MIKIKAERIEKCLLSLIIYDAIILIIRLSSKKSISGIDFLIGSVIVILVNLILDAFSNRAKAENTQVALSIGSPSQLLNILSNAEPLDIVKTGVAINPAIGGIILIRDDPNYNKIFSKTTFREVKVLVSGNCFLEGIGVLSSSMEGYELPDGVDILAFLSEPVINDDEFLGYHTMESLGHRYNVPNDWRNVIIDEKPTAFVVRDEPEPDELIGAYLKDWRERRINERYRKD